MNLRTSADNHLQRPTGSRSRNRTIVALHLGFLASIILLLSLGDFAGLNTFASLPTRLGRMVQSASILVSSFIFAWLLALLPQEVFNRWLMLRIATVRSRIPIFAIAMGAFLSAILIATALLRAFPTSADEYAYLFQADLFRHGRLWATASPIQQYIQAYYIYDIGGKIVSQYPPGWPITIAAFEQLGLPIYLINPLIGAVMLLALYRLSRVTRCESAALVACTMCAASGFFLFNSASFYNHSFVGLAGVLFATSATRYVQAPSASCAIGMGVWFAVIAATRHYDAILFALPVVLLLPFQGRPYWRMLPVAAGAAMPIIAGLLIYYWLITGDAFQTPMTLVHPWDRLLGPKYDVSRATTITLGRIGELAEWTAPGLVVIYACALAGRLWRRQAWFFEFYGIVFLLGYWLYWADGGHRWGPRYIYPAFPFMCFTIAAAWADSLRNIKANLAQKLFFQIALLSIVAAVSQAVFLGVGAARVVRQFEDPYDQIEAQHLHNAVVLFAAGSGDIWEMSLGNMVRNGISLERDVIYAHAGDIYEKRTADDANARALVALRAYFPQRSFWIYERPEHNSVGTLSPVPF